MGDVLSLSSLQGVTLLKPWYPSFFQFINLLLWILNCYTGWVTNFFVVFMWMMWVGCQTGTCYTNFLFLANARTNLECDMRLNYYERELVVNLLLISYDVGNFFAGVVAYAVQQNYFPDMLFNPPA